MDDQEKRREDINRLIFESAPEFKETLRFSGQVPPLTLFRSDGKMPDMLFCVEMTGIKEELGPDDSPDSPTQPLPMITMEMMSYVRMDLLDAEVRERVRELLKSRKQDAEKVTPSV
jgi:hypothetical protein